MANREKIVIGEYYHVYNRGVDKRNIFGGVDDVKRFIEAINEFNSKKPIGSLYVLARNKNQRSGPTATLVVKFEGKSEDKLVEIVCYCLNPNHYHFLLKEITEGGISEFMKRVGGGYTWFFNYKYKRSGSLFQGKYKYVHIDSNEQLLHLSAYINLNWKVHKLSGPTAKFVQSSWGDYVGEEVGKVDCSKEIILGQFKSLAEYKKFAEDSLENIIDRKKSLKEDGILSEKYMFK